jgi:hypothetical protein
MVTASTEIQSTVSRIFHSRKFIAFLYSLAHQWVAFGAKHIECMLLKQANAAPDTQSEVFLMTFVLADGDLGDDDNINMRYVYTTKTGLECQYQMAVSIRREDCAYEYQHRCPADLKSVTTTDIVYLRISLLDDDVTFSTKNPTESGVIMSKIESLT